MINKTILQGRLTKTPELKETKSGVPTLLFTVAWSEKYKEVETKCFMLCRAWRHTAEFVAKYFDKGSEIAIDGHLVTEEWDEKNKPTVLVVDKAHFCGSKSNSRQDQTEKPNSIGSGFIEIPEDIDEDLPFK